MQNAQRHLAISMECVDLLFFCHFIRKKKSNDKCRCFFLTLLLLQIPMRPRGSAHEIGFALQIPTKRERVSRFVALEREKVSAWELSDDFGTARGPFLLSAKPQFGRQDKKATTNVVAFSYCADMYFLTGITGNASCLR